MPRILFTATPKLPRDIAHRGYDLGTEVDVSDDEANRWLRRGVAEVVPPPPPPQARKTAPLPKTDAPITIVPATPA